VKHVLGNYLRMRVAGQILGLLLALTALIQLMELLEVTSDVLDRGLGLAGVLKYAALRVPALMEITLPLAGLLGSMAAFFALARTREITALRAAGVGLGRVMGYLLPVPLVFAMLHIALTQKLVPMAESARLTWWEDAVPLESRKADPEWVRTTGGIVQFQRHSADGTRLLDVRIYERGADGLLTLRTRAGEARWRDGAWELEDVAGLAVGSTPAPVGEPMRWQSNLRPGDVVNLDNAEPALSSVELAEVIEGERVSTRPASYYRTLRMQSFAAPFTVFIMMLLAIPAALVSERGGGGGRMLVALGLGLGFLLVDGVFSAFGTSGRIRPDVAAFSTPLAFAVFGLWQLRSCEKA